MSKVVLVTGGTGFVAGWCIAELLKLGYHVRTTVRNLSKEKAVRAAISSLVDSDNRLSFYAADLTTDKGWDEAVKGCHYVLHVASPLGGDNPDDSDALIGPAKEGTLRVLHAATKAGVERVVMTSSCAAATPASLTDERILDESVWTDPENKNMNAYRKSKTISELAAWKFMKAYQGSTTLTTILPGAVFGPVLTADNLGSVQVIQRLLQGRMPGTPKIGFEIIDVRDLADLHIRAMTSDKAAGERFIAVGDFMWMADIAEALRNGLGSAASKVPTRNLPNVVLRFSSLFDRSLRAVTPMLGRKHRHTSEKAQNVI